MTTKASKIKLERERRRKKSLFKKAYELGVLCNVDVAVIIRKNGRYFIYRSTNQESWPPAMSEIVSLISGRINESCSY
jgi:hypothetical protein